MYRWHLTQHNRSILLPDTHSVSQWVSEGEGGECYWMFTDHTAVCQASETSNTLLVKHYDKVLQTACGFLPFWETCPFWNYFSCLTQKASCSQGWDSKPASPEIFQYLNRIIHLQKGLVRIRLTLCTDKPGVREVGRFFSLSQIQFSLLCPPFSMSRTQI